MKIKILSQKPASPKWLGSYTPDDTIFSSPDCVALPCRGRPCASSRLARQAENGTLGCVQLLFLGLWLTLSTAQAVELQPIASIQTAVHDFVAASLNPAAKQQIDVMALDTHLQLPLCDQELEISSTTGDIKAGRNTLLVQCKGSQTWKIYSSATLRIYKEVLVLARPLRRNDVIHAEDVVLENREISTLTQGYLLDSADVVNKQAARNLLPGSVLNQQSYQDLTLVKRGDRVSIQLGRGGMNISMAGIAMTNGAKGDRINVRNISSQKQVQAVVVDTAQVSVNF